VLEDGFSNGVSVAGSKRSIRERLGSDLDDRNQHYDKRYVNLSLCWCDFLGSMVLVSSVYSCCIFNLSTLLAAVDSVNSLDP